MANKKISELTALGGTPANDDVVPVVDASTSTTKKVTVSNLLASKADSSHTHAISDVTNLQTSLDAKQATVTAGDGLSFSGDTLNAEVTQAELDAKQATVTAGDGLSFSGDTLNAEVTQAELDAKQDTVTAGDGLSFTGSTLNAEVTQAELDAKAASSHTHTLSDITDSGTAAPLNVASSGDAASGEVVKGDDSRLTDARTPSSHTHAISEVTNLQTSLDAKQATVTAGDGLSFSGSTLNAEVTQAELDAKAASSHTHTASEITDFDTEVANNSAVTANTAKVTNATHTGDATGSGALTVVAIQGRSVSSSAPSDGQVLKWNNSASEWQAAADNNSGGGGGGGSVGGSTGAIQFHDGSGFGGSSSLIWDNTLKRLGVGSSSPSYPLTIADGTPEVALEDTSSGGSFRLKLDGVGASINNYSSNGNLTFGTTGTGDFVFDTGNVGIGTSSPSAPIHVSGATNDGNSLSEFTQTGTGRGLSVLRNVESATRQMVAFAQTHASGGSQPVVHIQQADSDEIALGIDTSGSVSSPTFSVKGNGEVFTDGNVGIGTSSPSQKLQITGSNDTDYLSILLNSSSDSSKAIYGVEGNTAGTLCSGTVARAAVMASTSSGAALQLGTAGVIRATFDSSGNCAIGHSSPDTILHTLTSSDWVGKFESSDSYAAIILEDNSSTHNGNRVGVTGDNLHFTTAGTERARIDANGRLGIGENSPTETLHTKQTGFYSTFFERDNGTSGTQGWLKIGMSSLGGSGADALLDAKHSIGFRTNGTSTPTLAMIISDSQNVGIGSSSPSGKLEVNTGSGIAYFTRTAGDDGSTNPALGIAADSTKPLIKAYGDGLVFQTAAVGGTASERMRISSDGNLGIGTAEPIRKLDCVGYVSIQDTSAERQLLVANDSSDVRLFARNRSDNSDVPMAFYTGVTERMRIDSSGTLILAGNGGSATNSLDFSYNGTSGQASINADSNGGNTYLTFGTSASGTLTERVRISSSGNCGIGTASPSEKLHISGAGTQRLLVEETGSTVKTKLLSSTTAGVLATATDHPLGFDTNDQRRMTLTSTGLGIGETAPDHSLEINGGSSSDVLHLNSASPILKVTATNNASGLRINTVGLTSGHLFRVQKDGTTKFEIDHNGRVGIGTTSVTRTLTVDSGATDTVALFRSSGDANAYILLEDSNTTTGPHIGAVTDDLVLRTSDTERIRIASTGRVTVKKSSNAEVTALTDGATITPDLDDANNFSVTLGGNRTLANPSNCTAGQSGIITITQDGTGSRTLAYGSYWKFSGGTAPTLTTTASAVDVLAYYVESATRITATLISDTK